MAVAMFQEMPGGNAEMYDAVNAKMDVENDPPAGLILHSAGLTPSGAWRIFDVWESAEAYERFSEGRLKAAIEEVMGDAPPPAGAPTSEVYELHNVLQP